MSFTSPPPTSPLLPTVRGGAGGGWHRVAAVANHPLFCPPRPPLPSCLQSYGLNVARLAQLPESVIARAKERSEDFEEAVVAAKKASAAAAAGAASAPRVASAAGPGASPE